MLTLKAPIQLHIAQPLTVDADTFGQRIRGNYDLLGAHFAPRDLLFLMTAPPELPEELGGMTTLVNQQTQVDVRSISMEVINNVVNRILLDGTEQFTYQDQVYISTVLNRLGITNLEQFMGEVRRLRAESERTVHMTKLYRDEVERLIEHRALGEQMPALPLPPAESEEAAAPKTDPQVLLALDILNRLDTSRIYETVHAFQHSWTTGTATLRNQELRLSEQLRFSNQLSLAEVKQTLWQQPQLSLQHHFNVYETGLLIEAPQNEEAVLSQATAAALLSTVDSTVVQVLSRPQYQQHWVDIQNALWQVAENALARFEMYHTQPHTFSLRETESRDAWYHYAQELLEYQTLHQTLTPLPAAVQPAPSSAESLPAPAALTWRETVEGDEIDQRAYSETHSETLQQLHRHMADIHSLQTVQRTTLLRQELLRQREAERQLETRTLRNTILQKLQPHAPLSQPEAPLPTTTVLRETADAPDEEAAPPAAQHTETIHQQSRVERERTEQQTTHRETVFTPAAPSQLPAAPSQPAEEARSQPAPPPQPMELPLVPLTPDEAEEQAPDLLVETLSRIDRQNRTLLQTVQAQSQNQPAPTLVQPDLRQTMRSALRALEEPEQVMQELYTARRQSAAQTVHPEFSPQEEALLSQAQPQERALYEAVLAYQKNPDSALAKGLLRPASQSALHAALAASAAEQPLPALEHPAQEVSSPQPMLEEAQVLLERMIHLPGRKQTILETEPSQPGEVRLVHKQAAPDVTEELLEQLTQQRKSEIQRTESHQQVTQERSQQVDVRQMEKKVVTQTTEDVTELVNRTLARQMRTISDQVYRQMEKKLQTERSRRGRL